MHRVPVKNKVLVVTGAASGIGLAVCREFAREGAKIAMVDMDEDMLAQQARWFQGKGYPLFQSVCDVSSEPECSRAVAEVLAHFGRIDILFNNAGITQRGLFEQTRVAVFTKVMAVNFFGSLYITKAALPSLISSKGSIIVNESIAGVAPLLGRTGYAASKHALHGLFTSLRCELKSRGVHILIVCPGFIKTNLQTRALGWDGQPAAHEQTRIGSQQTPEFVAKRILYGVTHRKDMMVLTFFGYLGYLISRFSPSLYERLMTRKFRKELSKRPDCDT